MSEPSYRDLPILFVDDEPHNLELFRIQFGKEFNVQVAPSGDEALSMMEKGEIRVVVTDERMPRMSGIELLGRIVERWPDTIRIIVSAYCDANRLLLAINRGHAHEYVLKPWDETELSACVDRALAMAERRKTLLEQSGLAEALSRDVTERYDPASIIGSSTALKPVIEAARRAAKSDATVMIQGETGTGKELFARLLHESSPRASRPFVRVNCAALPEGLLESELFGHEQGAFTGAMKARRGRFELAQDGTILLDEIGDVSPKVQVSLLRVLQEKEFERVGGSRPIASHARVVAATHRDLRALVAAGTFREDLYYRLHVLPIQVPALRDRREDIPLLIRHFIEKHAPKSAPVPRVSDEALDTLRQYDWPGNVRELENLVQRALIFADGQHELTVEDFCFSMPAPVAADVREEVRSGEAEELRRLLLAHGGNCARAARAMNVPRSTFVSRAKKHGLLG